MTEQVTIEAEFLRNLMDARDASERLELTIAQATRERDREHQRAEKFLWSLMEVRKELRKRPDADELATAVQRAEAAEAAWRDLDAERMDMVERVNVANERAASLETTNNSLAHERDTAFAIAEKAEKARDTVMKQRDDAVLAADRIRKDCDGLAEKANAAKSEIFRLRQELADAVQQAADATNRAEAADTRAKFVDARATELANKKAMLADELTVTRNAGEAWKARCEKAEAELEALRARIDSDKLAAAAIRGLFSGGGIYQVRIINNGATDPSLRQVNCNVAKSDIADAIRKHLEGKS